MMSSVPPSDEFSFLQRLHLPDTKGQPTYNKQGQMSDQPISWLGMIFTGKEAQALWRCIIQTISTSIQNDQKKAVANLKKNFGTSEEG